MSPRLKGNSRDSSWGICPISMKGPREVTKTAITAFARERKFLICRRPVGDMQKERRR